MRKHHSILENIRRMQQICLRACHFLFYSEKSHASGRKDVRPPLVYEKIVICAFSVFVISVDLLYFESHTINVNISVEFFVLLLWWTRTGYGGIVMGIWKAIGIGEPSSVCSAAFTCIHFRSNALVKDIKAFLFVLFYGL